MFHRKPAPKIRTNSTFSTVEADQRHRDHAVVEQVIAELKDGPIAHLPSGSYAANAALLAHAVIAFNLARTAGVLATNRHARARWATLRTQLISVPARVATSARRLTLHLPLDWPWADAWTALFDTATDPPSTAAARPPAKTARPRTHSGKAGQTGRSPLPAPWPPTERAPRITIEIASVDQG